MCGRGSYSLFDKNNHVLFYTLKLVLNLIPVSSFVGTVQFLLCSLFVVVLKMTGLIHVGLIHFSLL
jgi:hypothetical protein